MWEIARSMSNCNSGLDRASLGSLNAKYSAATTGAAISINDGVVSGQGAANGCVLNGSVTVPGSNADVYDMTLTLANCAASFAALNGQFTGLAALNDGTSPAQLTIAVSGAAAARAGGRYTWKPQLWRPCPAC